MEIFLSIQSTDTIHAGELNEMTYFLLTAQEKKKQQLSFWACRQMHSQMLLLKWYYKTATYPKEQYFFF